MQREEAEAWFRSRGLPFVVRGSARGRALIPRTVPTLVFLAVYILLDIVVGPVLSEPASSVDDEGVRFTDFAADERVLTLLLYLVVLLLLAAVYLGLPIVAAKLTRRAFRGRSAAVQLVAGGVVAALVVTLVPAALTAAGQASYWPGFVTAIVGVSALLLLTRLGVGAILIWAIRKAAQQISSIGTMASRVLPLLLLVVMFAFFTAELWQAADALGRQRLWTVVGFLAALAVGFMATSFSDEIPAMRAASRARANLLARVQETPLGGTTVVVRHTRLSLSERVNVVLVLFLAQAVQVVAFVVVVFLFFILFGILMITPGVQAGLSHGIAAGRCHVVRRTVPGEQRALPGLAVPGRLLRAVLHRVEDNR